MPRDYFPRIMSQLNNKHILDVATEAANSAANIVMDALPSPKATGIRAH
ncbi:MAG: hypothetical protein Ct9H300mP2_5270 [Candidatus Neomarinimicrobiota bacterium]|nr:MAG: hypothetical protein Ct9H300mP2_5270 [Candidatus Neomarinimicrobiota bacterium]